MARRETHLRLSDEFRLYLLEEYEASCRRNSKYSLRAYAGRLNLDSSTLSKILTGKRIITRPMFEKISHRIGLGPKEKLRFESDAPIAYNRLSLDSFSVVSDWYHFAILELTRTKTFNPNAKWIGKELGITPNLAQSAIERLVRLKMLVIHSDGSFEDIAGDSTTSEPPEKSVAHRKLQTQLLEKAIEAVNTLPFSMRDQSAMTVAIHPKRLREVKSRIDTFRRDLTAFLERDSERERVYNLLISFFPLTQISRQEIQAYEN